MENPSKDIFTDGSVAFQEWFSFVPAFVLPFLIVSIVLTILLVVLKRANK